MEAQWEIKDFEVLMSQILRGELSVQEQFFINNTSFDASNHISFLDYLLKYKNIHKYTLLKNLYDMYSLFIDNFTELYENKAVHEMKERIKHEWYIGGDDNFLTDEQMKGGDHHVAHKIIKKVNDSFDNVERLHDVEFNVPIKMNLSNGYPLKTEFNNAIDLCKGTTKYIDENIEQLQSVLTTFEDFNLMVYIDLSMKHKSLYLRMNNAQDIPDNIHVIYSNFVFIHNLLHKQVIQQIKLFESINEELHTRCRKVSDIKENMVVIAHMGSR